MPPRRVRASVPAASPRPSSVTVLQDAPDPEVWGLARLYANGDTSRLKVIDKSTVLVLNHPVPDAPKHRARRMAPAS